MAVALRNLTGRRDESNRTHWKTPCPPLLATKSSGLLASSAYASSSLHSFVQSAVFRHVCTASLFLLPFCASLEILSWTCLPSLLRFLRSVFDPSFYSSNGPASERLQHPCCAYIFFALQGFTTSPCLLGNLTHLSSLDKLQLISDDRSYSTLVFCSLQVPVRSYLHKARPRILECHRNTIVLDLLSRGSCSALAGLQD